jgi:hypothetical protein
MTDPTAAPDYEPLEPSKGNWYRLRRWAPRHGYEGWPAVTDLCAEDPMLGLNENRAEALYAHDEAAIAARMRTYLDPKVPLAQTDARFQKPWAGFDPVKVRDNLLAKSAFDAARIKRFCVRPFDYRYAYIDTTAHLWNRSRPPLVKAAQVASDFLLLRRRAPRSLDGATMLFSRCLVDQHAMHKDAYVIPFWLAANTADDDGPEQLFVQRGDVGAEEWKPNLSATALEYLSELGVEDAKTDRTSAGLLWLHVLAVGFSPLYAEENDDAVRSNWPRIPLPDSEMALRESAALGAQVAALLDLDRPLRGADKGPVAAHLQLIAVVERADGTALNPGTGDLALSAGWGIPQARLVMPGSGKAHERERTDAERAALSTEQQELLGEQVLDVYLNDHARWRNVPAAAWDYKIGGFQVLRKWLSYRDQRVLGRDLNTTEARAFINITRRLTGLVLLGPKLDANYIAVTDSPDQGQLFPQGQS